LIARAGQSNKRGARRVVITTWLTLTSSLAGCGFSVDFPIPQTPGVDGNRDSSAISVLGKTFGEPNDTFADPIVAVFDLNNLARLQGTVEIIGDLDVFLLGPLAPGDLVTVDAATSQSDLDVSVGVFDGEGRLVVNNDDRGGNTERFLDSYVEWIVRHASDSYYLVVTNSPFASRDSQKTGSYTIDVSVAGGFDVPPPVPQLLMLDFDGGLVNSPGLGQVTIVPFDAAAIDPVYRGQTEAMKRQIRRTIEQNYERFGVTVITSDDPSPEEGVEYSTVFLGGFSRETFGMAESVDLYNEDYCDDAIVYTESFSLTMFTFVPTVSEMAVAIANVASHEAGHLLGLNHVDDDRALMDDQSPADVFITDQEFMEAVMSSDIMPIGTQDAVLLLQEIVGLTDPEYLKVPGAKVFVRRRLMRGYR